MTGNTQKAVAAAMQRHGHLSKQGLLERAFTWAFRGLVYAQIWEDPVVDMARWRSRRTATSSPSRRAAATRCRT